MGEQKPEKTKKHICAGLLAHVEEKEMITTDRAELEAILRKRQKEAT